MRRFVVDVLLLVVSACVALEQLALYAGYFRAWFGGLDNRGV